MTENNERTFETDLVEVSNWILKIGQEGTVENIDSNLLKRVLEKLGANIEISEEAKASLGKYSSLKKRPGLHAVWGEGKIESYKEWVKTEFIPQYEEKVGKELHTLWDPKTESFDNIKHTGMMQFIGELTAFAEGVMSFEDYKRLTEDRIRKGIKFERGDSYEPYKPSKHAAIPPEFPQAALKFIVEHKSE